ncbi:CFI-box-CTERM domain-containing protein [Papillibacter cinnamivorans]|uniref:Uncharacterized protein n=1 Tax=Papillibacter cinnamivorans DSM 12816 TaxID=1122930 RepID=A0A1W2AMG5_9FIRM|nr:CFI-box-CTERM domain-containing protein [Papillibacter cinnamivorans]SMC61919.1 hypothetical protein SAMN02745168_1841 [Papillibacter cinnamivorans DSM 12816]
MGKDFDNGFGAGFVFGTVMNGGNSSKKDGCYIATAIYGSYDCPEVWTLRRFRDYRLKQTAPGRAFVRCYYAVSPTLVKWFGGVNWLKRLVRYILNRLVSSLKAKGVEDTSYNDPEN